MKTPKYTLRRNGKRMATVTVPFAIEQGKVTALAERLGCSETAALARIRAAYIDAIGGTDLSKALTFDAAERTVKLVDDTEQLNENEETL